MVLDLLSQAPYSNILRWLLLFSWTSLKLEFLNIDIPGVILQLILVWEGGRGAVAHLLSEGEKICARGLGMLMGKPGLAALVGRSPKAAQETRGSAGLFPNTEPLPPVKSAAVEEI